MDGDESTGVTAPASMGEQPPAIIGMGQDRASLTALFDNEFSSIFGFVLARCGSRAIAEDVASETFVEAARLAKQGRFEEVTRSWLFMVARRRLIDYWRSDERHRRRIDRLRMARSSDPDRQTVDDDRILEALQSLPTRQRAALALRYLDEYSVSEIAEVLDVSYRAAESLLSRARASFATAYGGTDDA